MFKKKGHQEQHEFNERVCECLEEVGEEITKRPLNQSALDKAKQAVDEGLRLIGERQKLIKIANRSEFGWGIMAEYQADELASGSDDERKLKKAERATERKVWKRRKTTRMARSQQLPGGPPAVTTWTKQGGGQLGQQVPAKGQTTLPRL